MTYFLIKAILAYFEYPTKIDVHFVSEWHQHFPAVSICNISPIRLDRFIEPFSAYMMKNNLTNVTITEISTYDHLRGLGRFLQDRINANEPLGELFFALPSLMLSCTYNGHPCSATDFIPFISSKHGMCYTFNAKLKDSQPGDGLRYVNQYGGDGKLSLTLYAHQPSTRAILIRQWVMFSHSIWSVHCLCPGVGFLSLIHDNRQLPLIEAAGIELAPGRSSKLGYKKKGHVLLISSVYRVHWSNISFAARNVQQLLRCWLQLFRNDLLSSVWSSVHVCWWEWRIQLRR